MNRTKPLILIAEDEPDLANLLCYYLQQDDYQVRVAADGQAALQIALDRHPDLLVLDLMLPNLPGISICQVLQQNATTRDIPIIVVTAMVDEDHRNQSLQAGARVFLTKPINRAKFIASVQELLPAA